MSQGRRGWGSSWEQSTARSSELPLSLCPPSDGHFPENFSVLITLRGQPANQSVLLSIYDASGARQLGLALGPALGLLGGLFSPLPQQINLMDGR